MASAADKAEQRVHEQRRLIEQKLARLEARVKDDLSTAQTAARERTNDVTQSIPGRHQIERQVEQRPLTSMAAALAAGIGLGMLSESVSFRRDGGGSSSNRGAYDGRMYEQQSRYSDGGGSGSGIMSWLTGPATVAILGPVQSQIQDFVASALSGLSNGGSQRGSEASGQLANTPVPRREHTGPSEPPPDLGR